MIHRQTGKEHFVVGFAFDLDQDYVVLIEKQKAWCKGLWNGVGGSIELDDRFPYDAVQREFEEETGLLVSGWRHFCTLEEPKAVVEFFTVNVPLWQLQQVTTTTVEQVMMVWMEELRNFKLMPNLKWLIPAAMMAEKTELHLEVRENLPEVGLTCAA